MHHHVALALRQRDGIFRGRVEDVGLGVGRPWQAVAVRQLGHRPELAGRKPPPVKEDCRVDAVLSQIQLVEAEALPDSAPAGPSLPPPACSPQRQGRGGPAAV
jgi:hypothetical protein